MTIRRAPSACSSEKTAPFGSTLTVGATLSGAPAGSLLSFDAGQGAVFVTTDSSGHASAALSLSGSVGTQHVTVSYAGDVGHLASSARSSDFTVTKASTALAFSVTNKKVDVPPGTAKPKLPLVNIGTSLVATLTTGSRPLPQKAVLYSLTNVLSKKTVLIARTTDLNGRAPLGIVQLVPGVYQVTAAFGLAGAGTAVDPDYASSSIQWIVALIAGLPTVRAATPH